MPDTSSTEGPLEDRTAAGRELALRLTFYRDLEPVVLALPFGGVPVGVEIARALDATFDVIVVRKIGAPEEPELGVGAVAEGGVRRIDAGRAASVGLGGHELEARSRTEVEEIERRGTRLRGGRPRPPLSGRTVILVDDGVATGGSMLAAIDAVRPEGPRRLVVAVGVCPRAVLAELEAAADEVVVLRIPARFYAVGEWYRDFRPVNEWNAIALLRGG